MSEIRQLVSVIVPAFNRIDFISETVESVLEQDYPQIELIVVDDGSTDGTFEILEKYAEEGHLKLVTHPERSNRGQSVSLNKGLGAARGEYIAILDSDDLFAKHKISRQTAYLENNPSIDLVYGKGLAIDEMGNALYETLSDHHCESGDPARLLVDCYIAVPGGALVRKSLFERAGRFEESFRAAQDHDMALRLFEEGKVAYLPEVAFYYRKHAGSISVNGLENRWRTGFEILRRASRRYPYPKWALRKRKAVLNYRLAQVYWDTGRRIAAVPLLIEAAFNDPLRAIKVLLKQERAD